jgi:hypothetical protein
LANLSGIVKRLQKERAQIERQLWGLEAAIRAFPNVSSGGKPSRKRRSCQPRDVPESLPLKEDDGRESTGRRKSSQLRSPNERCPPRPERRLQLRSVGDGRRFELRKQPDETRPFGVLNQPEGVGLHYTFAYSALASFRMGMSWVLHHPEIAADRGGRNSDVFPVVRRDGPCGLKVFYLPEWTGISGQVHVQESR